MLPEGSAGALRRHEAIRQSDGTDGARQIHRESRVLVCVVSMTRIYSTGTLLGPLEASENCFLAAVAAHYYLFS